MPESVALSSPRARRARPPAGPPVEPVHASAAAKRKPPSNRRVSIQARPVLVLLAEAVGAVGRGLVAVARVLGRVLVLLALLTVLVGGGRLAAEHVMASPRFALADVTVAAGSRVGYDEVLELAGVTAGQRLLALDTDAIAARVAQHPWVAEARVRRQLPSGLRIEVSERQASAVVVLGALYLIDAGGRPFKRASVDEADGLPVITGLERSQYVDHRPLIEAAYREALAVVTAWNSRPGRPALGEVNLSPRYGFTLFLRDGGAEIRLGRGNYDRKLAGLDQIFEAVRESGAAVSAVRVVHLDSDNPTKIPVRLALPSDPSTPTPPSE